MTCPVQRIPSQALCFDALLKMMNARVNHLAVEPWKRDRRCRQRSRHHGATGGVTTPSLSRDRESTKYGGPVLAFSKDPSGCEGPRRGGARQTTLRELLACSTIRSWVDCSRCWTNRWDPAPFPFCWITFGSEGRKEQTFKTDQDNALIYETPDDESDQSKLARSYFRRFGQEATQHLNACGYPLCKGKMMASNPRWRKPFDV